ncbi:hypothetical protein ZIOFF_032390 [Zingiber officinale]|uniref:Isopenicillin N synthase-like Fe(2+) 2OG dioxygenase domain-containing protein n=1 Tax=Zingiber officinale TaxID=94328 RepID=A0A8J5L6C9_ZINOF|nr:hypothetical protein ZIOFF_032390 [Zingiber officinale]
MIVFAQALSNGRYKSAWHRAVVNSDKERISVASFVCPCKSVVINPPEKLITNGSPAVYKSYTYDEYYTKFWSRNLDDEHYSSSPSSGICSSGPPPSAKDATCYMSSTQSSPVDQDDKDGSGPEGHVTEPAMETVALQVRKFPPPDPSDVNSLHRPNDGATDGNENNDCIPGSYPVKKRKLSKDNENQPPILVMNQENLPSKNARTSVHHGEDNQVSRLNNNGAMVREGGKFGCDISHVNNYTTVAERSMDRFAALMSSFRYTQSSARASVLRAPLKDVQNSSSSASLDSIYVEQVATRQYLELHGEHWTSGLDGLNEHFQRAEMHYNETEVFFQVEARKRQEEAFFRHDQRQF